jgi:hypothetical protein
MHQDYNNHRPGRRHTWIWLCHQSAVVWCMKSGQYVAPGHSCSSTGPLPARMLHKYPMGCHTRHTFCQHCCKVCQTVAARCIAAVRSMSRAL